MGDQRVDEDKDEGDLILLARWRAGDARAGERLCSRYFDEIYTFFAHKMPEDADDLTQQTFLACVRAKDSFQGRSSFRTYLFVISRNELKMRRRRFSKLEHVDLKVSSLTQLMSSPSKQLGKQEDRAQLLDALSRLPFEQSVLLELLYCHDQSFAALAEIFETTTSVIRVRLTRAREALAKVLVELGLMDSNDALSSSLRS